MDHPASLLIYGRLSYEEGWRLQHASVKERGTERRPDTLILLEHEPVFTIGRRGQESHWNGNGRLLSELGYPVHHVERGGSVTYHGPGQIVGYPILMLNRFCAGPKAYMNRLEEVLIRVLAEWGIAARRIEKLTGVWVGGEKIAAMGVRLLHGVTMHGFALNVDMDLSPFERILPCGIPGCRVTSMARILGMPVKVTDVRDRLAEIFAEVFSIEWMERHVSHGEDDAPAVASPSLEKIAIP